VSKAIKGQPALIWAAVEIPRAAIVNRLHRDFQMYHYRGFTALSGIDREDTDFSLTVKKGLFPHPRLFLEHYLPKDENTDLLLVSLGTRQEAIKRFVEFVDTYHLNKEAKADE
jgi:hypothetical protein